MWCVTRHQSVWKWLKFQMFALNVRVLKSFSLSGLGVCLSGVWRSQSQPGAEEDGRYPAGHRQHRSPLIKPRTRLFCFVLQNWSDVRLRLDMLYKTCWVWLVGGLFTVSGRCLPLIRWRFLSEHLWPPKKEAMTSSDKRFHSLCSCVKHGVSKLWPKCLTVSGWRTLKEKFGQKWAAAFSSTTETLDLF